MMLVLTAVLALLGSGPGAPRPGPPFPRIANCYAVGLTPDSTPADIEEVARFDLLIGGVWCNWADPEARGRLRANIAAVRRRNPHILILDFSSSAPYADPRDSSFPRDGWLLQPDGRHIVGWPGTEMINLRKEAVLDWLTARSVASLRDRGFDGTFIDCMGSGFDGWACNIESGEPYAVDADGDGKADDRAWLDRAWTDAKVRLSAKVRAAIGDRALYMTNQAGEWGEPTMNGILLEDYLDYVLAGTMDWNDVLRTYLRWTRVRHRPNVTTIVSSSGLEPPYDPWRTMSEPERKALLERGRSLTQRMRFGLATTLMGDGYFAYDLHTRWRGQRWWYPEYDAPLGYPRGPARRQADGTWRRSFDGGTVVVNPTPLDAVVRLRRRQRDVSSGKVDTRFVVPTCDGRILLPTGEPRRAGTLPDPHPLLTLHGPEAVVERGEHVLCRMDGMAALFDHQGRLVQVTDGRRGLVEGLRAFIVRDDRWRDLKNEGWSHRLLPGGGIEFAGRRTEEGLSVACRQVVRFGPRRLTVTLDYEALSDGHLHMCRHQVDFPTRSYGSGVALVGGGRLSLPRERSPQPVLAERVREVVMVPPAGPRVRVRTSGDAQLVDERHYGVSGYRLGQHPARGDVRAGQRWESSFEIEIVP